MEPLDFLTVHTWWWEGSVHSVDAILWILSFWMVSDLWKNASCDSGQWRWATTPYSHRAEGETMPEAQWVWCTRSIMAYNGSGSHWFVGGQCKSSEWVCEPWEMRPNKWINQQTGSSSFMDWDGFTLTSTVAEVLKVYLTICLCCVRLCVYVHMHGGDHRHRGRMASDLLELQAIESCPM